MQHKKLVTSVIILIVLFLFGVISGVAVFKDYLKLIPEIKPMIEIIEGPLKPVTKFWGAEKPPEGTATNYFDSKGNPIKITSYLPGTLGSVEGRNIIILSTYDFMPTLASGPEDTCVMFLDDGSVDCRNWVPDPVVCEPGQDCFVNPTEAPLPADPLQCPPNCTLPWNPNAQPIPENVLATENYHIIIYDE